MHVKFIPRYTFQCTYFLPSLMFSFSFLREFCSLGILSDEFLFTICSFNSMLDEVLVEVTLPLAGTLFSAIGVGTITNLVVEVVISLVIFSYTWIPCTIQAHGISRISILIYTQYIEQINN